MKRLLFSVLIIGIFTRSAYAQTPESSLLWKISGNGLTQPSYIFGTFHIMCKSDFSITPTLLNSLNATRSFYAELKLDDPAMQTMAMTKMMMPDHSLQELIGNKEYTIVSARFQELTGISLKMLDHFKPFMAETMLLPGTAPCKETVQPEMLFMDIAKKQSLSVRGLESVEEQVAAIDKQPLDSQTHSLVQTVLHYDSAKTMMREMIRVYLLRNVDSLYRFMKNNGTGGDFELNMLVSRNRTWAPLIEKAMRAEPVFFAVGAGHLGGNDGVIALLRKRGFIVTPVKY